MSCCVIKIVPLSQLKPHNLSYESWPTAKKPCPRQNSNHTFRLSSWYRQGIVRLFFFIYIQLIDVSNVCFLLQNGISNSEAAAPGAHLAVGSTAVRLTLSRMASTPATAASSNQLAMILGNLTQQHRRLERTQSAPAPAVAAPAAAVAATTVNTSRYKTELCRPFEEFGVCKYGDKCQFAHGINELRSLARHPKYKTELCRTYHTVSDGLEWDFFFSVFLALSVRTLAASAKPPDPRRWLRLLLHTVKISKLIFLTLFK